MSLRWGKDIVGELDKSEWLKIKDECMSEETISEYTPEAARDYWQNRCKRTEEKLAEAEMLKISSDVIDYAQKNTCGEYVGKKVDEALMLDHKWIKEKLAIAIGALKKLDVGDLEYGQIYDVIDEAFKAIGKE